MRLSKSEYNRRYREKNPERLRRQQRKYWKAHPERHMKFKRTFKGFFSSLHAKIRHRCEKGNKYYKGVAYMTKTEWDQFMEETVEARKKLFDAWVSSDYSFRLTPSIDRIDPKNGYVVGNCQWLTHGENAARTRITGKQEAYRLGYSQGFAEAIEKAAQIVEGDVLLTADEFDNKTKIKVFDLLERIFKQIRALKEGDK